MSQTLTSETIVWNGGLKSARKRKEEVAGKTSLEQRVYNGLNGVQEYHLHWTGIKVGLDRRKEGWGRWILELQG